MTQITIDFFNESKIPQNQCTIAIMDYLTSEEAVSAMIAVTDLSLPALTAVVKKVEEIAENTAGYPLDHNGPGQNALHRQNVGRMVKYIMQEFGYKAVDGGLSERARLRDFACSKHFSSAAIYKKDPSILPNHNLLQKII